MTENSGEEKKPWNLCTCDRWTCSHAYDHRFCGEYVPLGAPEKPSNERNVTKGSQGHPEYLKVVEERKALHIEKSSGYGTGKDPFANFTAVAELTGMPRYVYPMLRAEEKLQRCWSLHTQGRHSELEEEFTDISSLFDCATAMLREDQEAADELSYK